MVSHFYFRPIAALLISLMGGIILGCRFPGHPGVMMAIGFAGAVFIGEADQLHGPVNVAQKQRLRA